jgi:hypothetical protein
MLTKRDVRIKEIHVIQRSVLKRIKDKIEKGKKLNYEYGVVKVLLGNYV